MKNAIKQKELNNVRKRVKAIKFALDLFEENLNISDFDVEALSHLQEVGYQSQMIINGLMAIAKGGDQEKYLLIAVKAAGILNPNA